MGDQISMEIDSYKKGIVNRRKELVLKVKRFELPSSVSTIVSSSYDNKSCSICSESSDKESEMDEEILCPICMCEINDGDRISALTCNHAFHVDCLKIWLKRSNVCPLCMCPNVAETRIIEIDNIENNKYSRV